MDVELGSSATGAAASKDEGESVLRSRVCERGLTIEWRVRVRRGPRAVSLRIIIHGWLDDQFRDVDTGMKLDEEANRRAEVGGLQNHRPAFGGDRNRSRHPGWGFTSPG